MNGQGYYSWPLRRLVCHHGHWCYVERHLRGVNGYAAGQEPYARLARAQGLLTYTQPPHSAQLLLTEAYLGGGRAGSADEWPVASAGLDSPTGAPGASGSKRL
jgi:hypothetical protein